MSSILKALKKVEDDKNVRKPEQLNIDVEILRPNYQPRTMSTGVVCILLFLMACASGATYLLTNRGRVPENTLVVKPAADSLQLQPSILPNKEIITEQPQEILFVPADQKTKTTEPPPPPSKSKNTSTTPPKPVVVPIKILPPLQAQKTFPQIRVNGIAFQNNKADSMAIVNGKPVSNGTVIEGVTVEEIKKESVVFLSNGGKLEVKLGQTNASQNASGQ